MWLLYLVLLFVVVIIILIIPVNKIIPNSGLLNYRKLGITDMDMILRYPVYFKIRNTSTLEKLEGGNVITPTDILDYLENQTIALNWLREYGEIKQLSDSGTMALFETTPRKLLSWNKNLSLYVFQETQVGTFNNYIKFPGNLVLNYFNFVNTSLESKTADQWTTDLKLSKLPLQNMTTNATPLNDIKAVGTNSRPLGFIDFGMFNQDQLLEVCQYLNVDYNTVVQNITATYVNQDLETQEITTMPWTNPFTSEELIINEDLTISLALSTAINADTKLSCYSVDENILDVNLLLWNEWKNPNSPRVIAGLASLGTAKIDARDYSRVGYESRLLSLCGYRLVAPSGYTGSYIVSNGLLDIKKPDLNMNILFGQGVITVGGVDPVTQGVYSGLSDIGLSTSGGYRRGYEAPDYKRILPIQESWNIVYESGRQSKFYPEIDYQGDLVPDVCAISTFSLGERTVGSVELSSVYVANQIYLVDPIEKSSLQKIMYQSKVRPSRPVQGNNALFSLPGYQALSGTWDPVQGLGLVSKEYLSELIA